MIFLFDIFSIRSETLRHDNEKREKILFFNITSRLSTLSTWQNMTSTDTLDALKCTQMTGLEKTEATLRHFHHHHHKIMLSTSSLHHHQKEKKELRVRILIIITCWFETCNLFRGIKGRITRRELSVPPPNCASEIHTLLLVISRRVDNRSGNFDLIVTTLFFFWFGNQRESQDAVKRVWLRLSYQNFGLLWNTSVISRYRSKRKVV
jgi:hypothetical protein